MASPPTTLSEPILVASLPLPPNVAAEVDHCCRSGRMTRRQRAAYEEEVKLRLHYGGHFLVATAGRQGLQIHAINLESPEEVDALTSPGKGTTGSVPSRKACKPASSSGVPASWTILPPPSGAATAS